MQFTRWKILGRALTVSACAIPLAGCAAEVPVGAGADGRGGDVVANDGVEAGPRLSDEEWAAGWISLFDGRTLFGWQPQTEANWRVEDGAIVVDRGEVREWCAGALARLYTEMGGESLYFGKPHPPIYDLARRRLQELGHDIPDSDILVIGDGPHTDILGGMGEGIDSLFISGGLAAAETKTSHHPHHESLTAYIEREKINPTYTIGRLR